MDRTMQLSREEIQASMFKLQVSSIDTTMNIIMISMM
jgi:hypothetical protein